MNPENNNPFSNTGANGMGTAGSAPAGVPPFDLTTPSGMNSASGASGLSMADSMASAEDNLTAAGLASPSASNVMGLDQISASSPSAMMTPPAEEPLVPAAPVPGSIGSVTSVPPTNAASSANNPAATPGSMASAQPTPSTNAASSMFTPVSPEAANPTANPAASAASDAGTPAANTPAASAPYNPFAKPAANPSANPAANKTTPSSTGAFQPAAIQKKMNLKDKLGGSKVKSPLILIMGGIIALLLVALIIFIVLYIGAVNNKEYVYVPSPAPEQSAKAETLTCTRQIQGAEVGKNGAVWGDTEIIANYNNNAMETISSVSRITFDSPDTAGVARGEYEASLWERAAANGGNLDGEVTIDGAVVTMNVRATADTAGMILSGQVVETTNDAGEVVSGVQVNTDLEAVQNEFTGQGFTCEVAEQ